MKAPIKIVHVETGTNLYGGALQVAIASPKRWALMHELRDEDEPSFAEVLSHIGPCDLILIDLLATHVRRLFRLPGGIVIDGFYQQFPSTYGDSAFFIKLIHSDLHTRF